MTDLRIVRTATLVAFVVSAAPAAGAMGADWLQRPISAQERAAGRDDLYRQGHQALDEARYADAAATFERLAKKEGPDADAALYWQGYALAKAGRRAQAREVLERLTAKHPKSQWLDDARALLVDLRSTQPAVAGGITHTPADEPDDLDEADDLDDAEEMKLYALNSLMNTESERAVAVLEKFLAKPHSRRLDEQAIFVLSQADSPAAFQLLAKVARGELRPELRLKAIETLGLAGDPESLRLLQSVYAAGDGETRAAVLQAFFLADEGAPVLAAARDEKDVKLRRKAIELLGLMNERAALAELYRREGEPEVRRKVIEALGLAGDAAFLLEIARQDADPAVRGKAIESIAVFGGSAAPEALASLYRGTSDRQVKEKIIGSFIVCDCAKKLIEIARAEKDRGLRRKAIQVLSVMGSEEASDFLLEALDES